MTDLNRYVPRLSRRSGLALGGAVLLAIGAAGGASAVAATRPGVEMAPVQPVAIASLPQRSGLVTVKGKVAEVYGSRFVVADGSGRTMIDAGREGTGLVTAGAPVLVQGRYDEGEVHASFLVGQDGNVEAVGPGAGAPPPPPPHGRRGGPDGPPPPPGAGPNGPAGGPGAPPPPPPGACGPQDAGAPLPPPPPAGAAPVAPAPVAGATPAG